MNSKSRIYMIVVSMVSILVVLFIVSFLSLYIANQIIYDSSVDLVSSYSSQQINAINTLFYNSHKSFTETSVNKSINDFLESGKDSKKEELEKLIKKIIAEYSAKGFFVIDKENTDILYCDADLKDEDEFAKSVVDNTSAYAEILEDFGYISFYDETENFVLQIFPLDLDDKAIYSGVIFEKDFVYNNSIEQYSPYSANPEIYFVSPNKTKVAVSNNKFEKYLNESAESIALSKDKKVFYYKSSVYSGLNLIYIFPSTKYTSVMKNMVFYISLLDVILLLASFLIILSFSNSILTPLKALSEKMKAERKNL